MNKTSIYSGGTTMWWLMVTCIALLSLVLSTKLHARQGVSKDTIRIGGVMDLDGRSKGLGIGMRDGIRAAFKNQKIQGRRIEYVTLNDSYMPSKTIAATKKIVEQDVFVVLGNVGTPTAKVSLPILAKHHIPAVGFFTGAGILRPGIGDIVNYRASYVQETAAVINTAIRAGVKPEGICAFVQNDAYGMAGVEGIKRALSKRRGGGKIVTILDKIIALQGDNPARNNIGPIGVYQRNTFTSKNAYRSLKNWEKKNNTRCQVVVSVGTYNAVARFAGYAKYKGENWIISAVSFTGADNFRSVLKDHGVTSKILMTQVVPPLNSDIPIVKEARKTLGEKFGYVTLEGYIVGKMCLKIMSNIEGEITRKSFLRAAIGKRYSVGGLSFDFTGDNQASDLVLLTYLTNGEYKTLDRATLQNLLNI